MNINKRKELKAMMYQLQQKKEFIDSRAASKANQAAQKKKDELDVPHKIRQQMEQKDRSALNFN